LDEEKHKTKMEWTRLTSTLIVLHMGLSCNAQQSERKDIPVGKGPDALFLTPDEEYLYVANVEDTLVSIISTREDRTVRTIGSMKYPWGFAALEHSTEVAVSTYGGEIVIVDYQTHHVTRRINLNQPLGGIASFDGSIYVVLTDSNRVARIDAASLERIDTYSTDMGPDGIAVSQDGGRLYVANTISGTISVIDTRSHATRSLGVGGKPELVHLSDDGRFVFVSNFTLNKLHILSTSADTVLHEIKGLNGPEEARMEYDRILYVVNYENSTILTFDSTWTQTPGTYHSGKNPIGVVISKLHKKMYVTNYGSHDVSVFRIHTQEKK
jgi:YVTN family beta-propeller protein